MQNISQDEFIFQEMKKAFESCEIPIGKEGWDDGFNLLSGLFHPEEGYKEIMLASYSPDMQLVNINSLLCSLPIEEDKVQDVLQLLNRVNGLLVCGFLRFRQDMKRIDLSAGIFLVGRKLDGAQFKRLLAHTIEIGHKFYPIFHNFLQRKTSKDDAFRLIDQAWPKPEGITEE